MCVSLFKNCFQYNKIDLGTNRKYLIRKILFLTFKISWDNGNASEIPIMLITVFKTSNPGLNFIGANVHEVMT